MARRHAPSPGREAMLSALLEMKASEVSSRGRLHGRMVPGTIHVGTSFMLCTQMSTSLFCGMETRQKHNEAGDPSIDKTGRFFSRITQRVCCFRLCACLQGFSKGRFGRWAVDADMMGRSCASAPEDSSLDKKQKLKLKLTQLSLCTAAAVCTLFTLTLHSPSLHET